MSDIHEKIMNLLALARNNPSEEEAATAAAMARKLMLKHEIDERDLGRTSNVDYNGETSLDRDYFRLLATGVGEMIPAKAIIFNNSEIRWAATRINAQIADELIMFWADQVEALYKIHLPRGMSKAARAAYRKDFKRNCAVGIIHRARDIKKQNILDEGEKGTALVVVEDQMMVEIEEFLATKNVRLGKGLKINQSSVGAAHGRQAAGSVQMQRSVR